jgi:hypothetical protein
MFWREHAPPHFPALYGEHEALIDIQTLEVVRGNCRAGHLRSPSNGPLNTAPN